MALPDDDDGSVVSELRESIEEEIEEVEQNSEYSLEFDDDNEGVPPSPRQRRKHGVQRSPPHKNEVPVVGDCELESANEQGHLVQRKQQPKETKQEQQQQQQKREQHHQNQNHQQLQERDQENPTGLGRVEKIIKNGDAAGLSSNVQRPPRSGPCSATEDGGATKTKAPRGEEPAGPDSSLPMQVLALRARLDRLVKGGIDPSDSLTATEALTAVTREHAALRECLGDIERELLTARRKLADKAAGRLRATQEKRARAEARRVRHFEQLGEARRAAAVAKMEAEALRERMADGVVELRHTRDMLESARSMAAAAEERADMCQTKSALAEAETEKLKSELLKVRAEAEEERRRASVAVRDAEVKIELCERKRELEVDAANRAAQARERAVEEQLKRLPEHHQQVIQAEKDRVVRWEERLAAESASLQRREEAHKIDMEACRSHAIRTEAEARARIEEDLSRERSLLEEARALLERERGELLRRVAMAEAAGRAAEAKAATQKAEADMGRRRINDEKAALEIKASMVEPQLRSMEERQARLKELQQEATEEHRRAKEKSCHALQMEADIVQREAAVEVKWKKITTSLQSLKQMEKGVVDEAEGLAEQQKGVALARLRLHEQQMEMVLQMSEVRKALELMKRVDRIEDAPARRLALELGSLAYDRGSGMAAKDAACWARNFHGTCCSNASPESALLSRQLGSVHRAGDSEGVEVVPCATPDKELGGGTRDHGILLHAAPWEGTARNLAAVSTTVPVMSDMSQERRMVQRVPSAYSREWRARETLEKVRSVIASASNRGSISADAGGGRWGSVQGWATRLQAATIVNGAHQLQC